MVGELKRRKVCRPTIKLQDWILNFFSSDPATGEAYNIYLLPLISHTSASRLHGVISSPVTHLQLIPRLTDLTCRGAANKLCVRGKIFDDVKAFKARLVPKGLLSRRLCTGAGLG